jgi:transcriptional regulator with XRE-family HTH domain
VAVNVNDKIRKLGPARRKKVEARAAELIAEEMTLRELRRARKLTQVRMAKSLGVTQDSVSRLEKRSDLLLSTLRKTVEAMGGSLSLVAEFPDRPPVVLSGIADAEPPKRGRKRIGMPMTERSQVRIARSLSVLRAAHRCCVAPRMLVKSHAAGSAIRASRSSSIIMV